MMRMTPRQLATVCIPWDEDGGFLEGRFRAQLRLLQGAGFGNLYIFGTAGEGYAVTERLYRQIATVFFDEMRAGGVLDASATGFASAVPVPGRGGGEGGPPAAEPSRSAQGVGAGGTPGAGLPGVVVVDRGNHSPDAVHSPVSPVPASGGTGPGTPGVLHNPGTLGTLGSGTPGTPDSPLTPDTPQASGLCQLGVIGMSTAQVRERIELGMEIGFRDFQISLPSWGTLTDRELARFFRDTVSAYPEATFLHYNTGRGGRILGGADYARLVAEHPNLVATKSGGHSVASLLSLLEGAPELCHFITELDYAVACLFGLSCGLLVSVSAVHPARSREFFEAGQRGDRNTLMRLTRSLNLVRSRVIADVGKEGGHMDGAYDKLYARLADPDFPLGLLSPYQAAGTTAFEAFKTWLETLAPDWAQRPEMTDMPKMAEKLEKSKQGEA